MPVPRKEEASRRNHVNPGHAHRRGGRFAESTQDDRIAADNHAKAEGARLCMVVEYIEERLPKKRELCGKGGNYE